MRTRVEESFMGGIEVTPSDTDNIELPQGITYVRGVFVDVTGDLSVEMIDGTTLVFTDIAAGYIHHLAIKRVNDTDTTATGIKALY